MAKSKKRLVHQNRLTSLLNENKFFVGLDVHKRSYHVSLWCEEHGLLDSWVQPAVPSVLLSKLLPFKKNVSRIVYEAGPTGFSLVRALRAAGFVADVIAPSKMLAMPGRETKTDRIDSKKLAMYAAKDLLTSINVPTEEQEAFEGHDRILNRYLKPDLLILDDMGMKQLPKKSGEFLFEIIMRRHEL